MSLLNVNKIDPATGTGLELGSSGDTITIPSGATITNNGTQTGFGGANTPIFHATMSGSDQVISNNTDTKLAFNSETFDIGGQYDTSNYRFTPTTAGKYLIGGQAMYYNTGINIYYILMRIYKNGSVHTGIDLGSSTTSNIYYGYGVMQGTTIVDANGTGDYFELYGLLKTNSGTVQFNTGNLSSFYGCKLITW